ncbi:MAG TPA: hypothetical protein VL443_00060 [Cyclobacteriaceae bacterium]|jgi:hypothetical protein|nr:hypothetical protein [Cyclobacteriaceae bacterium]
MRTSLNKIKETEDFILNAMKPDDALLFRARLILDPVLRMQLALQRKVYALIRLYGRRNLKSEIISVQENIFNTTEFREEIDQLFLKP